MKRLTTDTPDGAFQTMMNYVYGNNGWACIRSDGEHDGVPLTTWAKKQCALQGCDGLQAQTEQEIDSVICECMMDVPDCPIALAYCFASQAVHLRSRLKQYEDILFDADGRERLTLDDLKKLAILDDPLTLGELRELGIFEWIWVEIVCPSERQTLYGIKSAYYQVFEDYTDGNALCCGWPGALNKFRYDDYGKTWLAYRRRPEERQDK